MVPIRLYPYRYNKQETDAALKTAALHVNPRGNWCRAEATLRLRKRPTLTHTVRGTRKTFSWVKAAPSGKGDSTIQQAFHIEVTDGTIDISFYIQSYVFGQSEGYCAN